MGEREQQLEHAIRTRTSELAERFDRSTLSQLNSLESAEIVRLERKAQNVVRLLRAHLRYCISQRGVLPDDALRRSRLEIRRHIDVIQAAKLQLRDSRRELEKCQRDSPPPATQKVSASQGKIAALAMQYRAGLISQTEYERAVRAANLVSRD